MARGNKGVDENLKLFFMKIKGLKQGETIHIEQTEVKGEKEYVTLEEKLNKISGKIHKFEIREYQWEGDTVRELRIWLKDVLEGEIYAVGVGINSIGRSIINTILSLPKPYGELEIRVYNKKDNGYPTVYMEHNGQKVGWKYGLDEQAKHIVVSETTKKGKPVTERDYFKFDEMLINELKEVMASMDKTPQKFKEEEPVAETASVGADDIPAWLKD